jgi:hypothetical protein
VAIQKKHASEENDSNTDAGPDEESEEDLQDDDSSQAWEDEASQEDGSSNSSAGQLDPGQSLGNAAKNTSEVGSLLKHCDSRR